MNIDELIQNLPSREDLASAIGLHGRSSYSSSAPDLLPALGLFGTGMLFGAGLALLLAPKSGSQVRQDISDKVQELGTQARSYIDEASRQGRQMASEGYQSGQMSGQQSSSTRQMSSQGSSDPRSRNG